MSGGAGRHDIYASLAVLPFCVVGEVRTRPAKAAFWPLWDEDVFSAPVCIIRRFP